jgi:hypothetical protein
MKKLEKENYISLTCDFWTSFLNVEDCSFLGLTASYIDDKFERHDICLNCRKFDG